MLLPTSRVLATGILLASFGLPASILPAGCGQLSMGQATFTSVIKQNASDTWGAISSLDLKTGNGAIEITEGPEFKLQATVRAISAERVALVTVSADYTNGILTIRDRFPDNKRHNNEGVSYVLTLPKVSEIKASSTNGAITITGHAGKATLDTSNGAIRVQGFAGLVEADTSNGAIELTDVTQAVADTSNGRITITLADGATGPVTADTSNGAISLSLPASFSGTLEARTTNGSIKGPEKAAKGTARKKYAAYAFGDGMAASKATTTNGSITIVVREAKP